MVALDLTAFHLELSLYMSNFNASYDILKCLSLLLISSICDKLPKVDHFAVIDKIKS